MKILKLVTLFVALICVCSGCKKSSIDNPCNGVMNQSPPLRVGVLFNDKQTGINFIIANGLGANDIKISEAQTEKVINNWRIVASPNTPTNGMIELAAFHETAGVHTFNIEVKGLGVIPLSYTIKQMKSDNVCKMYYYPLEGLKTPSHNFKPLEYDGKIFPQIIVVAVN